MDAEVGTIVIVWPSDPGAIVVGGALVPAARLAGETGIVVDRRTLAYRDTCVAVNLEGVVTKCWLRAMDVTLVTEPPGVIFFSDVVWPW